MTWTDIFQAIENMTGILPPTFESTNHAQDANFEAEVFFLSFFLFLSFF